MSARYERVRLDDDDDRLPSPQSPSPPAPNPAIPNSPPPSFHSRASSRSSRRQNNSSRHAPAGRNSHAVDPALADAFGSDDDDDDNNNEDDSEDGVDEDRRRLVRSRDALRPMRTPATALSSSPTSTTSGSSAPTHTPAATASSSPQPAPAPAPRSGRVYGGGIQSDGVFSNLMARPEPGEEKDELPPTYEQAAADAAPPYWETTILAPGLGGLDEVYVDGMPVGSVFSFIWNGMISLSFQIVGFLLTYLLHSTHAAKNGSRAGLGITLIQYGFYMKGNGDDAGSGGMSAAGTAAAAGKSPDGFAAPPDPNAHDFDPGTVGTGHGGGDGAGSSLSDIASSDWVAYVLMIVGWFILIKSVSDYYKARRHEQLVLQSPERGLSVPVIATGESPDRVV